MSQAVVWERSLSFGWEAAVKKKWLWAGVDLGVETTSVCIIDDAGEVLHEGVCPSSTRDVRRELTTFRRTRFASVVLEAGTATHVARGLRSLGYPVELYEARQLSKFLRVRRNKTDAGDANGIAEAARISASLVSKVYLKSLASQSLQSCLAIRRHLVRQRVAAINMLGRQFEVFGGRLRGKLQNAQLGSAVDAEIRKLFRNESSALVVQLRYLGDHCERLIAYQRIIDRELKHAAHENEVCQRLMEIPGVGPLCALTFYAAVDNPHRFSRSADIGSYFGLAPRLHESGLISRKSRISKMGNKSVRSLLVHAAGLHLRYCRPDSAVREWTLRLEKRRGRLPSRVALARKLAVIMLAIWKSGGHFDPAFESPVTESGLLDSEGEGLSVESRGLRSIPVEINSTAR
jgi:transposase